MPLSTAATEAIGLTAGILTTVAFVPQVIKVWRTRSARDISLIMFLVFATGVTLWLAYGLILGMPSLILANAVTLVLALAVILMKLRFDARDRTAGKTIAPSSEDASVGPEPTI